MQELRFDGKTALVTGAGGNPSLGRAFAMLLAARGASVVVNDIGSKHAPGPSAAKGVADEINALGGKAVADANSVATEEGAGAMVKAALDAFGGLDIVVNNAGLCFHTPIDVISARDIARMLEVNTLGVALVSRAAWPHMKAKGYGRIVNITSGALLGMALETGYAASKGGVFSFTRALSAEGAKVGILVNSVAPGAFTRMMMSQQEEDCPLYQNAKQHMPAELVAPVVAYLAHETCPVNGECIDAVGGTVRRIYVAETQGFTDRELTIERLASRWDEVMAGAGDQLIQAGFFDLTQFRHKAYEKQGG
jgi:NAD(P)-dependent dehydrogenase (short-subunit alcohol dehydrogenase family)